jgi:hypothetical protein
MMLSETVGSAHVDAVVDACSSSITKRDDVDANSLPTCLYHLTDIDGFIGIISSKLLWASLATELNDPSEIRYGIDLTVEVLRERLTAKADAFDAAVLGYLLDPSSAPPENQLELFPLVISFCGRNDRSGMWLHYGRSGRGIALGFAPTIAQAVNMNLSRVDYDRDSQRARIGALLDSGRSALGPNPPRAQILDGAHLTSTYVLWLAIRLKHPSFAEEDEWRLSAHAVSFDGQFQDRTVFKYRRTGERVVPYEERPFADISLLTEVVVGYSSTTAVDVVRTLLRDHKSAAIATRSLVPVR